MFHFPRPVWQQAEALAPNPFSSTTDPANVVTHCHRCECDKLFPRIMEKVLRVKNTAPSGRAGLIDLAAARRRNRAISGDYARIYLEPLGMAKRLKFAGGAAFGSTHIGYSMDLAAETMEAWGSTQGRNPTDLVLPEGTNVSDDWWGPTMDLQEAISGWLMTGVDYGITRTGLRRLIYGNLAIYMDLGAVLNFCQMHEARFNFFRDGKVDEFWECFEHFVDYVKNEHSGDHPVYADGGSFGTPEFLEPGLKALAAGDMDGALAIIDHEQRMILEPFMYTLGQEALDDTGGGDFMGRDDDFATFMNALERMDIVGGYTRIEPLNGLTAKFSARKVPHMLVRTAYGPRGPASNLAWPQPLMYPFTPGDGDDFTNPDVRVPWFKAVVNKFMQAENGRFSWPSGDEYLFDAQAVNPDTDLQALLYGDLGLIRSWGWI